MMRVAMYYSNRDIRIEEIPAPEVGPGEILVRVKACGVCGSDVMEWYRIDRVPMILGHELAGEVVSVGEGVKEYKKGDRVVAAHHVPCGKCHYCRMGHSTVCETLRKTNFDPGGFSEYVRIPAINVKDGVWKLPENVSFEEATFVEPLACVLRGQRLSGLKPGQTVAVLGCGISGLLHIQLARINGAKNIVATDLAEYRLKQAEKFGADMAIDAKKDISNELRNLNESRLADLVVVCAQAREAFTQSLELVERGGTVLFFAAAGKDVTIPLEIDKIFWRNEVTLMSSYAGSPDDYRQALDLIKSKKVKVADMVTHKLPLEETTRGFELVARAKDSMKVIIEPNG